MNQYDGKKCWLVSYYGRGAERSEPIELYNDVLTEHPLDWFAKALENGVECKLINFWSLTPEQAQQITDWL